MTEIITGSRPFDDYDLPTEVVLALNRGENPLGHHSNLSPTHPLRPLLLRCWNRQPSQRPGILEVSQALVELNQMCPPLHETPYSGLGAPETPEDGE